MPISDLEPIFEQLRDLGRTQEKLQALLAAMLAVSRELDLRAVLRSIVTTAMELVGARYGAMGVLAENERELADFIPEGLTPEELGALEGVDFPRGRGVLGELIRRPTPLRVSEISRHPASVGFPPGHPPLHAFLGVAITVQGRVYGNLYLADRRDGQPFDLNDEQAVTALAGAAGVAIENARLYQQVSTNAERFQRLLLPCLPDLAPFSAAAVYRPASEPDQLGGDWYDALLLPDGTCAAVIGDVAGHDLQAAAAMSQIRNMLRALIHAGPSSPAAVLGQLDTTLHAITENPLTTALVTRIKPQGDHWELQWSSAGHPPPLVLAPGHRPYYLEHEPGLPLGVDPGVRRPSHIHSLPAGSTTVLFTDGLVEDCHLPLEDGMTALARIAAEHADLPPDRLSEVLAERHPADGHDDVAILALRTP